MSLIEIKNVCKEYHNGDVVTSVLRGVNIHIRRGEFVSLMGPSGSGKSTLMHIIGFLDTPTSGQYLFDGQDASGVSDEMLAALRNKKIGFVFQAFHLLPRASALENVLLPLVYSDVPKEEQEERAGTLLASVGLSHRLHHTPDTLSGGEKQRVAIARALVNEPDVILADEPTGNLDSKSGAEVMSLLQRLHGSGHTILLVTHERNTALHAERIIQLKDGGIISDEPVTQVRSQGELIK